MKTQQSRIFLYMLIHGKAKGTTEIAKYLNKEIPHERTYKSNLQPAWNQLINQKKYIVPKGEYYELAIGDISKNEGLRNFLKLILEQNLSFFLYILKNEKVTFLEWFNKVEEFTNKVEGQVKLPDELKGMARVLAGFMSGNKR